MKKLDRGRIHMGMTVEEAALEGKMGRESKKMKSEINASKEASHCAGPVCNKVEDDFELSKKDKRKKKFKKKVGVSGDLELAGSCNEDTSIKDYEEVDVNYQKEMEKKKKKKRKFEAVDDNDKSNKEIHSGEERRNCLQTDDGKDLGADSEINGRKEKKRHKEDIKKDKCGSLSFPAEIFNNKDMDKDELVNEQRSFQKDNIAKMKNGEEQMERKKNKKGRRDEEVGDLKGKKKTTTVEEVGKLRESYCVDVSGKVEKNKRKRKRKKKKGKDDLAAGVQEMIAEELGSISSMIEDKDLVGSKSNARLTRKKTQEIEIKHCNKRNKKKPNSVETGSEGPKPKVNSKKVRFSGYVEVFPSCDVPSNGKENNQEERLVQGKRFSPEEDKMIKESVFNYIQAHGLGEEGLNMVLHCRSYPKIKNCWKEIGAILPHRPFKAIYYRAHMLFERAENRSWTPEELELVRQFHEEHGPKWKELADALGKHRVHLKDTWRRIKLPNRKKGHWSQEEYQTLFDLVNTDLRMRAFEEKKTKHGMLRENISWSAISDKLSTRVDATCCLKWYDQLTSPMVAEGIWADADDYRLLDELVILDACCIEDVDWDNLLDHRSGDVCRKRWKQMVRHIGEHGNKSFAEQVDILLKRYCPDVLEAREAWDNKPVVS